MAVLYILLSGAVLVLAALVISYFAAKVSNEAFNQVDSIRDNNPIDLR